MDKELQSKVGEHMSGVARLEFMNTYIENSASRLSPDVDIKPFVQLIRQFESEPNLAVPLIMTGTGLNVEDGEIYVSNPQALKDIASATDDKNKPMSQELIDEANELVLLSLDRLIVTLNSQKEFDVHFGSDSFSELVVGEFAQRMASEQPEARKLIREYATDKKMEDKLPLKDVVKLLGGKNVSEEIKKPEKPVYPEPTDEHIGKMKELFLGLEINKVTVTNYGDRYNISFSQDGLSRSGEKPHELKKKLFVQLINDFCSFWSWRLQRRVTAQMYDMDKLETMFVEGDSPMGFAQLERSVINEGFTLSISTPDFYDKSLEQGIIHNPSISNIGTIQNRSTEKVGNLVVEYLGRFGEQIIESRMLPSATDLSFWLVDDEEKFNIFQNLTNTQQVILKSMNVEPKQEQFLSAGQLNEDEMGQLKNTLTKTLNSKEFDEALDFLKKQGYIYEHQDVFEGKVYKMANELRQFIRLNLSDYENKKINL